MQFCNIPLFINLSICIYFLDSEEIQVLLEMNQVYKWYILVYHAFIEASLGVGTKNH